jgi:hypothetical protein
MYKTDLLIVLDENNHHLKVIYSTTIAALATQRPKGDRLDFAAHVCTFGSAKFCTCNSVMAFSR